MSDDLDDLIRRVDLDRWLSSRFIADAQARADVIAIYAFDHELGRAPKVASTPILGEIRLTWWREAVEEIFEGRPPRAHPGVQALALAVGRRGLARGELETMIDARYRELDPEPMSEAELAEWARDTGGLAARLAAQYVDPGSDAAQAEPAGAAWALSRRLALKPPMVDARTAARRLGVQAFPAVAHAALAAHPATTELGKRLRITWAVALGRI